MADEEFLAEWRAWRERREARLAAPYGFLSITGMHWLEARPQRFDGVPGAWSVRPAGAVEAALAAGERLAVGQDALAGPGSLVLEDVDEDGVRVIHGDVELEVARRGAAVMLRPRDPASPLRSAYTGTPTFPPSLDWVVHARFHPVEAGPTDEGVVGEVVLTLAGEQTRMAAFEGDDGGLWLVFSDATSGRSTYAAGRQLSTAPPGPDGSVVLDLNRTVNLPCAYTAFTTCPVPPPQNRLTVPVEAGEKDPARA